MWIFYLFLTPFYRVVNEYMNCRRLLTIVLVTLASVASGQTENFSSLSMFNYMYYNPGYAGDGNEIEARGLVRNQWMGFEGAPQTQTFSIDAPFKLFGIRNGAGLTILNDEIGNFQNIGLNFSYAYRRQMLQGEVGFGAGLSMTNQSFKGSWVFPDGGANDPWVPQNTEDKPMFFDMNLGFYYSSENVYLSCSMRNLLQSQIKYTSTAAGEEVKSSYFARQLFVGAGYEYQLTNPLFTLKPNLFIATDFATTTFSLSGILTYNEKFYGGVAYKPIDAIVFLAGISLPSGIEVAVSYDLSTSSIINYSSGSLEFMLGYSFSLSKDKDNRKYKSVRFL